MRRRADRIDRIYRITRMRSGVSRTFCESCKSCPILSTPLHSAEVSPSVSPCLRVSYHELTPEEREIVKGGGK